MIDIKNKAGQILDLYLFIFVFPISHTVPGTRKFNTYMMDWIESSSWVIALHPNSTNISPELLTSAKLIDLRFISSPVQPMQLIFWLTVKCFIADKTSSMKIKRKNLINIPSGYFSYNSLLVHSFKKKLMINMQKNKMVPTKFCLRLEAAYSIQQNCLE